MTLHPRVSRAGVLLVKRFEGYRRVAARLHDGGFVVGHGHTLHARGGMEVSEAEAEALLWFDLSRTAEAIEPGLLTPVAAAQFEALTSFAFNIGAEAFAASEVLKLLNEGAYLQAAAAIELWRRAEFDGDARVVDALVRRRAAEKAHFLTPPEGFAPAPTPVLRPRLDAAVARSERVVVTAAATEGDPAAALVADPPGLEGGEPAPSATLAAVTAVSARIERILGKAEVAPPDATPSAPQPQSQPEPEPAPAQVLEPIAEPPPFFRRREPIPANDVEPDPEPASDPPPPPPPPPAQLAPAEAAPPPAVRSFAFEPAAPPPSPPPPASAPAERTSTAAAVFGHVRAFAVLGLVGVALFVGAMLAMLHHPSLFWLFTGLVGVIAIAPASAFFLFRLAERPPRG